MDSVRGQKILNIFTFLLCHTFTTGLDTVCPARKHLYTNCTNPCLAGEGTVFCHSDLTTRCQPDYCGGCIARFFNDVGQEVHCTAEYGFICELKSHIIGCHDQPGKVLHVTYANYGRTSTVVCVHPYGLERLHNTTTCRSPSSLSVVRGWCEGQTQCTITAANELFGEDPCFGIYKYLEVEVECVLPGTVCSYSNNLANRPVNNSMHRPLKLKIQNALNQVILGDAESRGVFVGGRRRNRKKRRTRNVKEKKKARKCEGGRGSPMVVRNNYEQTVVPVDERPLIESDFDSTLSLAVTDDLHYVDDLPPLIDTEDQENVHPEEMPFGFLKKKNKDNSDKDVILEEEEVKMVDESAVAEEEIANSEQHPEDGDINNQQQEQDSVCDETVQDVQTVEEKVEIPEAEDATVTVTVTEEPAILETKPEASVQKAYVETADEVVPPVEEVDPVTEHSQQEITGQQEADDSQDGTPNESVTIEEQVGTEVREEPPKIVNGKKVEESSPLIKKQEPEVDMNFMCCVIL